MYIDNSIINQRTNPVKDINYVNDVYQDMSFLMNQLKGIGLAAPQVGIPQRFFLMKWLDAPDEAPPEVCINPKILEKSEATTVVEEGCLSFPDKDFVEVTRYKKIKVLYYSLSGQAIVLELEDLQAAVFQHELDHLNGRTIYGQEG